jgi:hypothetical protein
VSSQKWFVEFILAKKNLFSAISGTRSAMLNSSHKNFALCHIVQEMLFSFPWKVD